MKAQLFRLGIALGSLSVVLDALFAGRKW